MSFPRLDQKVKDKDYHLSWGRAILQSSITDNWSMKYRVMQECYKFFNSGSSGELTNFLQKAEDGAALPALWLTISSLKSKIECLIGELEERGYDIRVRALSREAISRKLEEKETLRVERRLQPTAQFAEQQTGLPLQQGKTIPQTDLELDEYIDLKYKDKAEIITEAGLKWMAAKNGWDETRKAWFRDVWISDKTIARNEIVRGVPRAPRVDPMTFIFDPNATDDTLSDSTYFGELYYMGLGEAAERYNLTSEELKQASDSYDSFLGSNSNLNQPAVADNFFGSVPKETVGWFKNIDGTPRVMVARLCWSDFKERKFKDEVNEKYGTEHLQEITEDVRNKKGKTNVRTKKMNVWRQITLIGGCVVREWGECVNQARDIKDLEPTESPYTCWVPNYLLGQSVSKTEQVVGLELLRDMSMYNFQLTMNRAGAKGFVYDLALKPENMTFEQVMGYLKVSGIIPVNSKEYQMMQGGMNVLKEIDMSISTSINEYMKAMAFIDDQINSIIGTSPERQGSVTAASQAVGVTQMAIAQNNMVTAPMFKGFERFCSRVQNKQAKLMRMAWANREVFAPIIGDTGIDFLKDNIDLELEEVGVIVESLPPLLRDRAKLDELVALAVQSQQMSIEDALAISLETDIKQAVRKLQRKAVIRKTIEEQQAAAEQQRQAEFDQRLSQMDAQKQQQAIAGQVQVQGQKNEGALERTLAQSRTRLQEKKIDLLSSN